MAQDLQTKIEASMDETEQMIQDCQNWEKKLNEWETGFIQGVDEQYGKKGYLSPGQLDKLEAIWNKVTR